MRPRARKQPLVAARFHGEEWSEEVGRFDRNSPARVAAERARREIETGGVGLPWLACEVAGSDGTSLPNCAKLYLPLGEKGASAAPFGFVFQFVKDSDHVYTLNFIAFGERHPRNPATRTVYERAHKRLHGRYPE